MKMAKLQKKLDRIVREFKQKTKNKRNLTSNIAIMDSQKRCYP